MFEKASKLFLAIFLFMFLYLLLNIIQPEFVFENKMNKTRQFGVGYKKTTILPLWLMAVLLAIISYFTVMYVLQMRFKTIFG